MLAPQAITDRAGAGGPGAAAPAEAEGERADEDDVFEPTPRITDVETPTITWKEIQHQPVGFKVHGKNPLGHGIGRPDENLLYAKAGCQKFWATHKFLAAMDGPANHLRRPGWLGITLTGLWFISCALLLFGLFQWRDCRRVIRETGMQDEKSLKESFFNFDEAAGTCHSHAKTFTIVASIIGLPGYLAEICMFHYRVMKMVWEQWECKLIMFQNVLGCVLFSMLLADERVLIVWCLIFPGITEIAFSDAIPVRQNVTLRKLIHHTAPRCPSMRRAQSDAVAYFWTLQIQAISTRAKVGYNVLAAAIPVMIIIYVGLHQNSAHCWSSNAARIFRIPLEYSRCPYAVQHNVSLVTGERIVDETVPFWHDEVLTQAMGAYLTLMILLGKFATVTLRNICFRDDAKFRATLLQLKLEIDTIDKVDDVVKAFEDCSHGQKHQLRQRYDQQKGQRTHWIARPRSIWLR